MLKRVFLASLEAMVMRFGPWKIPKCLENGPLWDQKWIKRGSKTRFSNFQLKINPRPLGVHKQVK